MIFDVLIEKLNCFTNINHFNLKEVEYAVYTKNCELLITPQLKVQQIIQIHLIKNTV